MDCQLGYGCMAIVLVAWNSRNAVTREGIYRDIYIAAASFHRLTCFHLVVRGAHVPLLQRAVGIKIERRMNKENRLHDLNSTFTGGVCPGSTLRFSGMPGSQHIAGFILLGSRQYVAAGSQWLAKELSMNAELSRIGRGQQSSSGHARSKRASPARSIMSTCSMPATTLTSRPPWRGAGAANNASRKHSQIPKRPKPFDPRCRLASESASSATGACNDTEDQPGADSTWKVQGATVDMILVAQDSIQVQELSTRRWHQETHRDREHRRTQR
jgi:hypothetical protein